MSIVEKCINWNSTRYEQIYNHALSRELLTEENNELDNAITHIEALDAIGDITFVAIGILWKLGYTKEMIEGVFNTKLLTATKDELIVAEAIFYATLVNSAISTDIERFMMLKKVTHMIFNICIPELITWNMQSLYFDVVNAICESNNTKEVQGKVDPSIKANIIKGDGFIPPTKQLMKLYKQSNGV